MAQLGRFEKISIKYLAGLFDGEGCVTIYKRPSIGKQSPNFSLRISVTQTVRIVPEMFRHRFGGSLLVERRAHKNWKDCYDWVATSNIAARALASMLPYLIVKRKQAVVGLRFQVNKRRGHRWNPTPQSEINRRDSLRSAIKTLNRRGI